MPAPEPEIAFDAPWQAQLFAMTVALHEAGSFSWADWTDELGAALKTVTVDGHGGYYGAWLRAFERILVVRGLATAAEVADLTEAWHAAALATPHGEAIALTR
ncbi:MAG: nitrile hydratase accessory protein [Pseudomonadota bacterium]